MSNPSLAELGAQCFPIYRRFEMSRGEVCCGSDMVSAAPSTDLAGYSFAQSLKLFRELRNTPIEVLKLWAFLPAIRITVPLLLQTNT